MPKPGQRNILITSALPYVNNVPHLGNIIGSTLSADVFSRFHRARNNNVLYICGTDEYGTATETKALEEGVTPKELCDKYFVLHRDTYKWFDIDFDYFGRTTTEKQTEIAQDIFMNLYKNGYTHEEVMTQLYCEGCHRFLADRYVEGICPKCGYEDARGDQCDKCGSLLEPIELIKPRCKLDGTTPVMRDSTHIFLELDKLEPEISAFIDKSSKEGKWSQNGTAIAQGWARGGLRARCITRDLKWGTPVPLEKFKDKVFYVWFDACIGYPSITANYTKDWEQWWRNPENVSLYQFMGKDNVPFHSVIFPGSQIGTRQKWTMVHNISTSEYLNYENGKFSKSRNVGVFGNAAKDTNVPVDVWRYYLLVNRPETSDASFSWKEFILRNNGELLANVGNFVNRTLKFINAKYNGVVPEFDTTSSHETDVQFLKDVNALLTTYVEDLEDVHIRSGVRTALEISSVGNAYLQHFGLDNKHFETDPVRCAAAIGHAVNLIYLLSAIFFPYMPSTSASITNQLNVPARTIPDVFDATALLPGHKIGKPEYLFKLIDEKMEDVWRKKYGGDSSAADAADAAKKAKEDKKKKAKKTIEPTWDGPKPPEMIALEEKITAQGDKVRTVKTEKASPEIIKENVDALLLLKKDMSEMILKLKGASI